VRAAGLRDWDGGERIESVVVRIVFWPMKTEVKVAVSGACYGGGVCESVVVMVAVLVPWDGGGNAYRTRRLRTLFWATGMTVGAANRSCRGSLVLARGAGSNA